MTDQNQSNAEDGEQCIRVRATNIDALEAKE